MTVTELMAWHQRQLDRLERSGHTSFDIDKQTETDLLAATHWDAVQLLRFCIEVPSTFGGDEEGRSCAHEMVNAEAVRSYRDMLKDAEGSEDEEDAATAKKCARFFAELSGNALEINEPPPPAITVKWS
jgi:hypothetical protein